MTQEEVTSVIRLLVSLFGILTVVTYLVPKIRVAWVRNRLFALRDDLFEWMVVNKKDFSDPAYRNMRFAINSQIRFADRVHPLSLFAWRQIVRQTVVVNKRVESTDKKLDAKLAEIELSLNSILVVYSTLAHFSGWAMFAYLVIKKAIRVEAAKRSIFASQFQLAKSLIEEESRTGIRIDSPVRLTV